ncbi:MAG: glucose 1-dehydrogenase [Chloroflexota bacterium]
MGNLENKVAIITGGSSGIGRATVERFVAEGAKVVVADLDHEQGAELVDHLGGAVSFITCNVSREEDVHAVVSYAAETFGKLDIIFNNAGYGGVLGPIDEIDVEGYDAIMDVLLKGVFLGMKHAAAVMKPQGYGSIISTASVAGLRTGNGPHIYSTAKAAVIHLTRSVAAELGHFGIRVNCICPGAIPTPIFLGDRETSAEEKEEAIELLNRQFVNAQPMNRAGSPNDIAAAALFLASDDSSFVNGHALVVDGGLINSDYWAEDDNIMTRLAAALDREDQGDGDQGDEDQGDEDQKSEELNHGHDSALE